MTLTSGLNLPGAGFAVHEGILESCEGHLDGCLAMGKYHRLPVVLVGVERITYLALDLRAVWEVGWRVAA